MKACIDNLGRVLIPKPLRERYRLEPGTEVEIVTTPDGIMLVRGISMRWIVRRGRVTAVDTGAGTGPAEMFSPHVRVADPAGL